MSSFVPSTEQLVLLSAIAEHIVVTLQSLATGDIETDLARSIDLKVLDKEGIVRWSLGDELVHATKAGRIWLRGHEYWHTERRRYGSGH